MARTAGLLSTLLFHKPYGVLSQFSPEEGSRWECLADYIQVPDVYAAGRLDADSEGLLLLTSNGRLQQRRYWVQVEGEAHHQPEAIRQLEQGIVIQQRRTLPARVKVISDPPVGERNPPIRQRLSIPTSWLELELREGRNRQVRRMTAAVGLPTLRLVRVAMDLMDGQPPLNLDGLAPGSWRYVNTAEERRLQELLQQPKASPGRGGRAGGGKSGRAGGGG
ncbi:MAG: pseudouridine synthase [Synechococcaceae bacterium WB9_2_170]|nr:pseudouridine synthase [Synechococcaceae bacterium WB9_2_170]